MFERFAVKTIDGEDIDQIVGWGFHDLHTHKHCDALIDADKFPSKHVGIATAFLCRFVVADSEKERGVDLEHFA
jgi:N-acyl-D-aspartate/D-glutamate deacylase